MFEQNDDWQDSYLYTLAQYGVVAMLFFVLLLIDAYPFHFGNISDIKPALILSVIYYWAIIRPHLLSYAFIFVVGMILDLQSYAPLGLSAIIFILTKWSTSLQRRFLIGQSFYVIWAGQMLVVAIAALVQWVVNSIFMTTFLPITALWSSVLFSIAVFPVLVLLLSILHKGILLSPEDR